MLSALLRVLLFVALALCPALALAAPWRSVVTVAVTTAGWKNVSATAIQGELVGWSIRADSGCTNTSFTPFLVDQVSASGSSTPSANPPAEYRVAEKDSQAVVASATEPVFATTFAEPMPFYGGLNLWLNVVGGTTCTYKLSMWGTK